MSGWVAGAIVVGSVVAAESSKGAAKTQTRAAEAASEVQSEASVRAAEIQAEASTRAAEIQAQAAREAGGIQERIAQQQIEEARRTFEQQRGFLQPYQEPGLNALARIQAGISPGGEFARPFTMDQFQADPGYAFRLSEGQKALERQAAARGGLISGSALKAASRFGQEMGSQEFQNAFARAQTERANALNPLIAMYGTGAETAAALSGAAGGTGSSIGNYLGQSGAAQAGALTSAAQAGAGGIYNAGMASAGGMMNAAQARASGYLQAGQAGAAGQMGVANAVTGGVNTGLNLYMQQQLLNRLASPTMVYGGGF
jgi:hypothetical protein